MQLKVSIIGSRRGTSGSSKFRAFEPRTGQALAPDFFYASAEEIETTVRLAHEAFATYGHLPGRAKATFLRAIAAGIESVAPQLTERAEQETALPQARLQGETARTCGQLRLFAKLVEDGSWVNARIDRPDPERKPLPNPDLRSLLRPLGPVSFWPSNFPLAFSVAGGNTLVCALAGGNPVIVKGHGAHPGTSEIVGEVISRARVSAGCRRVFLPAFRQGFRGWDGAGEASLGQGGWVYRVAGRWQDFDGPGGRTPGADSGLHRDEQYEPCLHPSRSHAQECGSYGLGAVCILHHGFWPVLYQARHGLFAGKLRWPRLCQ